MFKERKQLKLGIEQNVDDRGTYDVLIMFKDPISKAEFRITIRDAFYYFSQFGHVIAVRFESVRNEREMIGFITFASQRAIEKCLSVPAHQLLKLDILVIPCGNWRQPKTIFHLDNDCIVHILNYLTLNDHMNLAYSHDAFRHIITNNFYTRSNELELEHLSGMNNAAEFRRFFQLFGARFHVVRSSRNGVIRLNNEVARCVREFCPALTHIDLEMSEVPSSCLKSMLRGKSSITKLNLSACNLNDRDVLALQQLAQLDELKLAGNFQLTGMHLEQLTSVRTLDLHFCYRIRTVHLIATFKALCRLREFDVRDCRQLNDVAISVLSSHCHQLETLRFTVNKGGDYAPLRHLRALHSLHIHTNGQEYETLLETYAELRGGQLLELSICTGEHRLLPLALRHVSFFTYLQALALADCAGVTDVSLSELHSCCALQRIDLSGSAVSDDGVLLLVQRCTQLVEVNVADCNVSITEMLVWRMAPLLSRMRRKLTLHVRGTGIRETILQHAEYKAQMDILKLNFG